jgi:hypothetical protein
MGSRNTWRRRLLRSLLINIILVVTAGCEILGAPAVTAMHLANIEDQASTSRRGEQLWEEHRQGVRLLRAHGDPMGDYFYALGNAHGWIADTKNPLVIRNLLEKSAIAGSADAQLALGLFYFSGVIPGGGASPPVRLPSALMDRTRGLQLIRLGMSHSCTYAVPMIDVYLNRAYIRHVSAAGWIWPYFRDGDYERDASGRYVSTLEKDPYQEKVWHDIDLRCGASGAAKK